MAGRGDVLGAAVRCADAGRAERRDDHSKQTEREALHAARYYGTPLRLAAIDPPP